MPLSCYDTLSSVNNSGACTLKCAPSQLGNCADGFDKTYNGVPFCCKPVDYSDVNQQTIAGACVGTGKGFADSGEALDGGELTCATDTTSFGVPKIIFMEQEYTVTDDIDKAYKALLANDGYCQLCDVIGGKLKNDYPTVPCKYGPWETSPCINGEQAVKRKIEQGTFCTFATGTQACKSGDQPGPVTPRPVNPNCGSPGPWSDWSKCSGGIERRSRSVPKCPDDVATRSCVSGSSNRGMIVGVMIGAIVLAIVLAVVIFLKLQKKSVRLRGI